MSDTWEPCGMENPHPPRRYCSLLAGHHGRHADSCDDPCTWPNENETRPCPSTEVAILGAFNAESPPIVRCGMLLGHDGPHRWAMSWGAERQEANDG